jgi:hypothetical protein
MVPWFMLIMLTGMGAIFVWVGVLLPLSAVSVLWTLFWILLLVQSLRMAVQKYNDTRR